MTVALASDLHLGTKLTVLENGDARERFLASLDGADELVLLGDTLDLRYAPVQRVLELARPFLADLARVLDGRRVVFVPGNHDHELAAPIVERVRLAGDALPLETVVEDGWHGPFAAVASAMPGARVALAYPGLHVRSDVYATHGHYVDCHMTTPRGEVILASLLQRLVGRIPEHATPSDYEAVLAPLYSLSYELAQRPPREAQARPSRLLQAMKVSGWRMFEGRARKADTYVVGAAVATLNRFGLGPYEPNLSPDAVERAGCAAVHEFVRRLAIAAPYVVAGHTHRAGTWTLANGTVFVNTGSWGLSPTPPGRPGPDPYEPGTFVLVRDTGPPEVHSMLSLPRAKELTVS